MAVYVDNYKAKFKNYIMCHMIADSEEELHSFAIKLGLKTSWYQNKTKHKHYDISQSVKQKAIELGAMEVSAKTLVKLSIRKNIEGNCGNLEDINKWYNNYKNKTK
tara:strand:- start:14884 stop:15201 length:318 start_codon:yes stop_codon:yes gene_type:complete